MHMVLFIEALLQDIQIVVLLPEAVGFDEVRPHHPGQRRQVRMLFQVPQGGERHTKQFDLESAGHARRHQDGLDNTADCFRGFEGNVNVIAFPLVWKQHVARLSQSFGIHHPHRSSVNDFVQQVA
ncbi:hypothetical protein D3C73_1200610 [compost metagenome]